MLIGDLFRSLLLWPASTGGTRWLRLFSFHANILFYSILVFLPFGKPAIATG